jgi:hypothetical protein
MVDAYRDTPNASKHRIVLLNGILNRRVIAIDIDDFEDVYFYKSAIE